MHGLETLKTLQTLKKGVPTAVILRHAARYPILDLARPELAEITPEGAEAAQAWGQKIDGFAQLRLFHSPVKRCRQTAECIADGAVRAGLRVVHSGPESALGVTYIRDLAEAGRLSQVHGEHFVRMWLRGEVSPSVIMETKQVARTKIDCLMHRLDEPGRADNCLDVHVSHDWNIMVLREHMLGLRHEETGWLGYLDGLCMALDEGALAVAYRAHRRDRVLPWPLD